MPVPPDGLISGMKRQIKKRRSCQGTSFFLRCVFFGLNNGMHCIHERKRSDQNIIADDYEIQHGSGESGDFRFHGFPSFQLLFVIDLSTDFLVYKTLFGTDSFQIFVEKKSYFFFKYFIIMFSMMSFMQKSPVKDS